MPSGFALANDILQVRTPGVNFHVLRDSNGLYLIDAGFFGGKKHLQRALHERGWEKESIVGIIATHGHLDHILNVGALAKETGAWIAAPRLDLPHYTGEAAYRGWARVTGVLEAIGRPLLGFQPFIPDRLLDDGDTLDIWHGLRAIHLPGHTAGHLGLYCESLRILFAADLFASFSWSTHRPPAIFNSNPEQIPGSIAKALELDLAGVLPNHGDGSMPEVHLERWRPSIAGFPEGRIPHGLLATERAQSARSGGSFEIHSSRSSSGNREMMDANVLFERSRMDTPESFVASSSYRLLVVDCTRLSMAARRMAVSGKDPAHSQLPSQSTRDQ
jgi:glyoxylase-like metal-dependent hydrolase (beta-lactamase superfamily II)